MGLFSRKPKEEVWRNASNKIVCPGDSCPKKCDDSCPIYLNTQAAMLIMSGQGSRAINLYEKALKIAPDFYDAWNNLGGIYGGQGKYQKAHDCYLKAHEANKRKPNPVYGLILTSRDLKRYDDCIAWCEVYKTLSNDGRERSIRDEVNKKLGKASRSNETNRF